MASLLGLLIAAVASVTVEAAGGWTCLANRKNAENDTLALVCEGCNEEEDWEDNGLEGEGWASYGSVEGCCENGNNGANADNCELRPHDWMSPQVERADNAPAPCDNTTCEGELSPGSMLLPGPRATQSPNPPLTTAVVTSFDRYFRIHQRVRVARYELHRSGH